ncbi:unnamed protein product [Dibothriocephalus latus]|uniref:Reverse transcriptase domain-containing protein n=1 Tax=Dibothriocephalus latus TaxID=60516 RepID=A0A3P7M920_DIBLA|nr:unnamed protein product [Dibothriocephalus latus]
MNGVAMGLPLGPLLADIFMGEIKNFQLSDRIHKLKHYGRYVDAIFVIATTETDRDALLNAVSQAHPFIMFTLEMKPAVSLLFLDVLLSRRPDGSIQMSVFRKKTWSGQYTNFKSFVPLQQKRNPVRCLTQRPRKFFSTDSIEEELKKIQNLLRENGYAEGLIATNMSANQIKPTIYYCGKENYSSKSLFEGTRQVNRYKDALTKPLQELSQQREFGYCQNKRTCVSQEANEKKEKKTRSLGQY